ncbi:MAG: serine/threonine-protein kinase PknK, partial [Myxococcales bacterium]|nr:serine/threonine-protein kinase PknK [Myxococcales bacterium]
MGEVWRGVHRGQRAAVAIKVLTGPLAQKPQYRTAFREEVRAAAMLSHPHIVTVYDYGHVGEATTRASDGRYPQESPYLVMELVEGGALTSLCGRADWPTIRRVLLALLDALGHAHARGLVHRDLKPHNVLLPAGGPERGVKLTDFGLAHALYREEDPFREHMAGTPNYMAPEQVHCAWRDYGPWTDLYAVGCVAFSLVTGHPPFRRLDSEETLQAHLYVPPPPLVRSDVPAAFERFVHRLLEKEPERRYACAADAAWALLNLSDAGAELGGPTREDLPRVTQDEATDPTEVASAEPPPALSWRWRDWAEVSVNEPSLRGRDDLPPLPADWRRDEVAAWNPLLNVGLGLYGLRAVPLVDRFDERDVLWRALCAVAGERRPRGVVLRGPAGFGKSRLAAWLGERGHELGAATLLRAGHNPIPSARDGLGPMLAAFHVCQGLDRDAVRARLERALRAMGESNEETWHQLAALIAPPPADDEGRLSTHERFAVLEAHLRRLSRRRPLVLWIDDAQWGPEAVAVARRLLATDDLPTLLVFTVEEENRAADVGARYALERLAGHPAIEVRRIGALPGDHRPDLVRALLGLHCEVAAEVETRTEGSPLFAIHLVGDWVQRGALVPGPAGFTLRADATRRLPDGIHDIWRQRIDEVLAGRTADRLAIELAALLGRDVDDDEWRAACARAALTFSPDLVELLVARRLAVRAPGETRASRNAPSSRGSKRSVAGPAAVSSRSVRAPDSMLTSGRAALAGALTGMTSRSMRRAPKSWS